MLDETRNQFSLTRAAFNSTGGPTKSKFLSVTFSIAVGVLFCCSCSPAEHLSGRIAFVYVGGFYDQHTTIVSSNGVIVSATISRDVFAAGSSVKLLSFRLRSGTNEWTLDQASSQKVAEYLSRQKKQELAVTYRTGPGEGMLVANVGDEYIVSKNTEGAGKAIMSLPKFKAMEFGRLYEASDELRVTGRLKGGTLHVTAIE